MRQEAPEPWASAMRAAGMVHGDKPSIRQLADRAGFSPETARKLVFGYVDSDAETVEAAAKALRVDVRVVAGWVGQKRSVAAPYQPPAEASLLNERQRRAIDEVIRAMALASEVGDHGGDTAPIDEAVRVLQIPGRHGEQIWMATTNPDPSLDMLRQAQELASEVTQGGDQAPSSKEGKPKHGNAK